MTIRIRAMTPADVDEATEALARNDWGDRRTFFAFAAEHPACDAIVAVEGGRVVGTGVGTRNGPVGWVGTIFVVPELRGVGLGTDLTERICDDLEAAGCRTLALVATDQGRPLYERLGFEIADWYVTVERDALSRASGYDAVAGQASRAEPSAAGRVATDGVSADGTGQAADRRGTAPRRTLAAFRPADVPAATALDRAATGEDRAHLLAAFATLPGGLALRDVTGALRGFVVRAPWGGGATVAPDPADALRLLDARLAAAPTGHRVRAGTLLSNATGLVDAARILSTSRRSKPEHP